MQYSRVNLPCFRNRQRAWKCWYFYITGLFALKFWVPSVLRFGRRWVTCFIKSGWCLGHRMKTSTEVWDHSTLGYSGIILQIERSAGTQRSLSPNQAAVPVAEVCRYTHKWAHTYILTHRKGTHFYQPMPNFPLVPCRATRNWYGFVECILFSTKGVYGLKCLSGEN